MVFNSNSISAQPEILKRKLGGELFAPITITDTSLASDGVVKGGTPIDADGKISNDGDAIGILLNDVYKENPNGSLIKAFATVNLTNAEANSGLTLASTCKAALTLIDFD